MTSLSANLLGLPVSLSFVGLWGNVFLIISIMWTRLPHIKTYEWFLLGLAVANLEEILVVDIYSLVVLELSSTNTWACCALKFLILVGENISIFLTVLISIYRYQKLRHADKRVRLPIFLDNIRIACLMSGLCVFVSLLLSSPVLVLNSVGLEGNITQNLTGCRLDYFHCSEDYCPVLHHVYKYVFITSCNLLPLMVVTVSSCLIIMVLLSQRKTVAPVGVGQLCAKRNIQRSTLAVLAAMLLFQVDWILYLVFQLMVDPDVVPLRAELEFFISTSYTSISPYVYGIGSNLFTLSKFTMMCGCST